MRSHKSLWIAAAVILLFAAIGGVVAALWKDVPAPTEHRATEPHTASLGTGESTTAETEAEWGKTIVEDGKIYRLNPNLHAILFLGVDDGNTGTPGVAPGEGRRADTILLLVLNDETKQSTALSVSRDTMTNVEVYEKNGDYAYTGFSHINMQYYFGDSDSRSCYLMKKAVSRLLYGIQIEGCLSLKPDGIVTIVDQLGGLSLTMPADYTDIDPRYTEGASVTLSGAEAERLLRYRDITVSGSNETRAARHLQVVTALFDELHSTTSLNELESLLEAAGDGLYSDLNAQTLKKLLTYHLNSESRSVPGTVVSGENHDEFHVDEAALRSLLIELFYQPVEDE